MTNRRPVQNQRRSRKQQNLLEVSVRSQLANKQRNKRLASWGLKLLAVFALVAGSVYGVKEGVRRFFWENPKYNLAAVEIHNPGASLSREIILEASKLKLGENLFQIRLADAQEALTALPQVEAAELRRVLPNKVAIEITERRPIAWLAENGVEDAPAAESSYLVDSNGVIFQPKQMMQNYLRLPVIYGVPPQNYLPGEKVNVPELASAIELISRNGETGRVGIETVDLRKGYCILVTDARGRKISFPLDEAALHLDRLSAVLEATASRGMEVQTVNLLVRQNIPVTLVNHQENSLPPEPSRTTEAAVKNSESLKSSTASPASAVSTVPGVAEPTSVSPASASVASTETAKSSKPSKPSKSSRPAPKKESKRTTSSRSSSRTASRATEKKVEVRRAVPARPMEPFIPRAQPVR